MTISSFDDLLRSAREQDAPQRLLFVFTAAGVPDDATQDQHARFKAGEGGTLTPLMCVDKTPDELVSFDALRDESRLLGTAWDIVFVAAMAGSAGSAARAPTACKPKRRCSAWSRPSSPVASAASFRSMLLACRCSSTDAGLGSLIRMHASIASC